MRLFEKCYVGLVGVLTAYVVVGSNMSCHRLNNLSPDAPRVASIMEDLRLGGVCSVLESSGEAKFRYHDIDGNGTYETVLFSENNGNSIIQQVSSLPGGGYSFGPPIKCADLEKR